LKEEGAGAFWKGGWILFEASSWFFGHQNRIWISLNLAHFIFSLLGIGAAWLREASYTSLRLGLYGTFWFCSVKCLILTPNWRNVNFNVIAIKIFLSFSLSFSLTPSLIF
jgi:hypothetical protein